LLCVEVCNSGSAFNSIFVHAKYTSSMCVWHWRQWRHCNSWISRNFRIEIWSPVIWAKHQLTTDDKPTGQRSTGRRIVSESNTNPNPDTGPKFYRPVICFFLSPSWLLTVCTLGSHDHIFLLWWLLYTREFVGFWWAIFTFEVLHYNFAPDSDGEYYPSPESQLPNLPVQFFETWCIWAYCACVGLLVRPIYHWHAGEQRR